jgi:DNA polymerase-3 subunit epsilon
MNLFKARLLNRWTRYRLGRGALSPVVANNLEALSDLRPDEPAASHRFVVVDLETTGLDFHRDRVISVGAFRLVNGRIKLGEVFSELVNPGRDIPVESIRVHAIVPDMIRSARPAWEIVDDFLNFLGHDILVAHHARFDLFFINRVLREKYGYRLQNLVLDTILMCRHALPDPDFLGVSREAKRCSIDALTERFNLKASDRHTALGDALVTALIFQRLLSIMEERGFRSLRDLIRVAGS